MMHKALLALCITSLSLLSTLAYTIPEGSEKVELVDIDGNPLPLKVLNALYFKVKGAVLNASRFISTFNGRLLANMTVEYHFCGRNWSIGFTVDKVSEDLYRIYLQLKNATTLSFKFFNMTVEYVVLPHVASIASVVSDPTLAPLTIEAQLDDLEKPLKFGLRDGVIYIPVTSNENKTYPWIIKVYHGEVLIASSKLTELINGSPLEVPILVVSQHIELSRILGVDPSCNITVRLSCGNLTLSNTPPQLTLQASYRWIQPRTVTCQVEYIFEDQVRTVCNQSLENIFHHCPPEIYSLRMILKNADEHLSLFIDSSRVDISKPVICVCKGNYNLIAFYNFSGLLFKLWEKNITVSSNSVYTVQFNFTNLTLRVKDKSCIPTVYVNGTAVSLRQLGDVYEIKRLPLIPVNITVKVCELNLALNISSLLNNIEMTIDLPPPPVYEKIEVVELTPLIILIFIIILQTFFLIFLIIKLRGS